MTRISALTALASADAGDTLPILDVSATTTKKITKTAYLSDVIDGTLLGDNSIQSRHIDWADTGSGDNGGIWWEELGRTTLGSAGDTLSVASFADRKYLKLLISLIPSGAMNLALRFNSDSGTNYSYRYEGNNAATATAVSATQGLIEVSTGAFNINSVVDIVNRAGYAKSAIANSMTFSDLASAAPASSIVWNKWANTSVAITTVALVNVGAGDIGIGSELIILGHN